EEAGEGSANSRHIGRQQITRRTGDEPLSVELCLDRRPFRLGYGQDLAQGRPPCGQFILPTNDQSARVLYQFSDEAAISRRLHLLCHTEALAQDDMPLPAWRILGIGADENDGECKSSLGTYEPPRRFDTIAPGGRLPILQPQRLGFNFA